MHEDRRTFLGVLFGAMAAPALLPREASAQGQGMSRVTAFAFHFAGLSGGDIQLAEYAGKPILVVNTASQCGYTPQYAGLQELWKRYRDRGLLIVGVP
jgi:glutathione peroxidase